MKLYVFLRFQNSITMARNNFFLSYRKIPGSCHSPYKKQQKVKIDLGPPAPLTKLPIN